MKQIFEMGKTMMLSLITHLSTFDYDDSITFTNRYSTYTFQGIVLSGTCSYSLKFENTKTFEEIFLTPRYVRNGVKCSPEFLRSIDKLEYLLKATELFQKTMNEYFKLNYNLYYGSTEVKFKNITILANPDYFRSVIYFSFELSGGSHLSMPIGSDKISYRPTYVKDSTEN